jgi:hypothetical protein
VGELRSRFKETPADGALLDLAYLSQTVGPDAPEPTVVTSDWNLLDGFSGRAGTAGRQTAPYGTSIGRVNVKIHPLKTPANPQLAPTPMRKLVEDAPDTVAYGTEVKLSRGTNEPFTAYVYGYDTRGRVRVVWPDGETQELLAPNAPMTVSTNPQGQIVLRDDMPTVPPPTAAFSVTNFEWKPKQYTLDQLDQPDHAFRSLAGYARRLPELAERSVAEREELTVKQYVKLITDAGFQCFVTGGAVRDILLGGNPNDIDLATTMPAPDLYADIVASPARLGKKGGRQGQPEVRKNFPFSIVQIEPTKVTGLDILSTHDLSHGNSSLSLDMDAFARDFTINALYFDPTSKLVIDPTGSGLQDIVDKKLRFVRQPGKAVAADPVMAARWIKFMKKGYTPADPLDQVRVTEQLSAAVETMDAASRSRFIDRSGLSPKELVAEAEKLSLDLAGVIRAITGTQPT